MAEKRTTAIKGLLNQPAKQTPKPPVLEARGEVGVVVAAEAQEIVKGTPYKAGNQDTPIVLSSRASELTTSLQSKARNYLAARRRSGETLLEAARWMSEARAEVQHGQWLVFLEVTDTTPDAAERLVNIYTRSMSEPAFGEAVRNNWINPSVAGLLARSSTPSEVVAEVVSGPKQPTKADVERKIKQARQRKDEVQIPHSAVFGETSGEGQQISALEMLHETVKALVHLERTAHELPANAETEQALVQAEQAVAALRQALRVRG